MLAHLHTNVSTNPSNHSLPVTLALVARQIQLSLKPPQINPRFTDNDISWEKVGPSTPPQVGTDTTFTRSGVGTGGCLLRTDSAHLLLLTVCLIVSLCECGATAVKMFRSYIIKICSHSNIGMLKHRKPSASPFYGK